MMCSLFFNPDLIKMLFHMIYAAWHNLALALTGLPLCCTFSLHFTVQKENFYLLKKPGEATFGKWEPQRRARHV